MNTCTKCGSSHMELTRADQEIIVSKPVKEKKKITHIEDRICVVENVLVERCKDCSEVILTEEGKAYIEDQRIFFENNGLNCRIQEKSKHMTYQEIADKWGSNMERTNIFQMVSRANNGGDGMYLQSAFKFASILGIPFMELFEYRPILKVDGKYYLSKDTVI